MKKIRYLLGIGIALLLIVSACSTADYVCENDNDCNAGTEKCLWMTRGGQIVGKRCVTKCTSDADCVGGGKTCTASAKVCPACIEVFRICEE